ncbi:MAG: insulinase family protein [Spirochaetaceae bacterium]|nr:insulinase family protein [Spirochaetaceae bacterium]
MKKIAVFIFSLFILVFSYAENVQKYTLSNGIEVYIRDNQINEIDAMQIFLVGGVAYYPKELSGIEDVTFDMMLYGSKNYTYEQFKDTLYDLCSSGGSSAAHYTGKLYLVSIRENLLKTMDVFLDGFLEPRFEKKYFDLIMQNNAQHIQSMLNDPVSLGFYEADKVFFEGLAGETSSTVTPESFGNISLELVKKHHKTLMDAKRIKIAAVTGMDKDEFLAALEKKLGSIPSVSDEIKMPPVEKPKVAGAPIKLVHESAAGAGYIMRFYNAAPLIADDFYAEALAETIFSSNMYNVIRSKYGACYTPYCTNNGGMSNIGYELIYKCTDYENIIAAMKEARELMAKNKIITGLDKKGNYIFSTIEAELESYKNQYITASYSSQQKTSSLAARMVSGIVLYDNPEALDNTIEKIRAVKPADIKKAFEKYVLSDEERWVSVTGQNDLSRIALPGEESTTP